MRRRFSLFLLFLLPLVAPAGVYETLQKCSEQSLAPDSPWVALSARAELETPWRPSSANRFWNHAVHEFQETRRFLLLLSETI